MVRKDLEEGGEQKYYTFFKEPNDVRRMTFMVWKNVDEDDSRWIYIPALDLVKRIAANDRNSSFVGSDFSYEDVSGRHWKEDNHTLVGEDNLNGKDLYVIKSVPKDASTSKFSHRMSWVDKETYLPLKEEYYDGDEKVKEFEASGIKTVDNFTTITIRTMTDVKKNHKTVVAFTDIDYNVGVEDNIFTERFLRKPPQKYIK